LLVFDGILERFHGDIEASRTLSVTAQIDVQGAECFTGVL